MSKGSAVFNAVAELRRLRRLAARQLIKTPRAVQTGGAFFEEEKLALLWGGAYGAIQIT